MPTQGQPAVTTVTTAVSGPLSSNTGPSVVASASALPPPSSSTVLTTVSSAIMSMAVAVQAENLPMPVCSEKGASKPPNSQSGCGTTSRLADAQNSITVTMLGDALQTVNARMQGSDPVTRAKDSVVQSLLQCIQQLETLNAENLVLQQRRAGLEIQAYQVQSLTAVY